MLENLHTMVLGYESGILTLSHSQLLFKVKTIMSVQT